MDLEPWERNDVKLIVTHTKKTKVKFDASGKSSSIQGRFSEGHFEILSSPPIVSFSGPKNCEINGGNETIGVGLKQLGTIGDFLQIVLISTVKMKQMKEIRDKAPS